MTRRFLPWAILAASLALTLLATVLLVRSTRARSEEAFRNAVESTRDRIEARVQLYTALLRGTAGVVAATDGTLSMAQFATYVERLGVAEHYPGVQGLGYTRWLRGDVPARVAAQWAAAGLPDVRPWPDTLAPGAQPHAIVYLEPQDERNRVALGFNMHTDATRRAAMDLARDTGEPALSGRVTLVQETSGPRQAGFLLYYPIYRGGGVPPTEALRRERLDGFAYAPFRADDLFLGIFGTERTPRTAFRIYDGPPTPEHLLHDSRAGGIVPATATTLHDTRRLQLSGRAWTIAFEATEAAEATSPLPLGLFASGLLLSLLLFGLARAQQRAAEGLQERERDLDAVVQALPQLVWRADPDGRVTWTNDRWRRYTGLADDRLADDRLAEAPDAWLVAVPADDRPRLQQLLLNGRAHGTAWQDLVRLVGHDDGAPRWFLAQVVPVRTDEGAVLRWFGTFTDVTEQHHAREAEARALREQLAREAAEAREADLKAHMQELERSNRELQEFAYVASHDLQEPLRKIQTYTDLVRIDAGDRLDAQTLHFLERVQNAAGRMSQLIKDVLAVSRVSQGTVTHDTVALDAVLENVRRDLSVRLQETGGTLEAAPLPTLVADATQMHQLLVNLVGNALKFHREGVPPVVRVWAEPATVATPHGARPAVRVHVADNGIGIDAQHLARIFAPFQRLHRAGTYDGTGIGLSVCRRIAERHGGTLTAHSTPGKGTTFSVTLPLEPEG